jgi:IPT/TIG domain-containing protein
VLVDKHSDHGRPRRRNLFRRAFFFVALPCVCSFLSASAQAQSAASATRTPTIVLPPKIVAGGPVTLAVLGMDGRLASGVTVELGDDRRVTTDRTGRAFFPAPSVGSVLLATTSGASAATLIDAAPPARAQPSIAVAPVVSLRDRFSICGSGFGGNSDENRVKINDEPALVIAASPECVVLLPGPKAAPGAAKLSVDAPGAPLAATTTVVSLDFEPPNPPLLPGKRGRLVIRARGSEERLRIVVDNQAPDVLRFLRRDVQELLTSGGPRNSAALEVEAIRSGDFSFHARMLSTPDSSAALRYLQAAEPLAPRDLQHDLGELASRLAHHPRDFEQVRRKVKQMISRTMAGDFRTLLDAARAAL